MGSDMATIDEEQVAELLGRSVNDLGATISAGNLLIFTGTERFFRPGYAANLLSSWIPALDGVQAKLEAGARVADVGCGHGASTLIMAHAYPNSTFVGFDYHQPSVQHAQQVAANAGLADGTFLLVEPYAGDRLEDNLTPVGRAGFGHFRRVAQTPFNLVYEARP